MIPDGRSHCMQVREHQLVGSNMPMTQSTRMKPAHESASEEGPTYLHVIVRPSFL